MSHLVLLGDSIFDNGSYVPGEPAVIAQVRAELGPAHTASLLAVDGDITNDVTRQLGKLPTDATHLFVSVGGNDALQCSHVLDSTSDQLLAALTDVYQEFQAAYHGMLTAVLAARLPVGLCTIYDAVPGLPPPAAMALSLFNDTILRCAFRYGLPVIDLRLVCEMPSDYSPLSPIEPSSQGGHKIARQLVRVFRDHDWSARISAVYGAPNGPS